MSETPRAPRRSSTTQRTTDHPMKKSTTRRQFIKTSAVIAGGAVAQPLLAANTEAAAHQATGVKVGEVTDTTAIVWTRLTARPTRKNDGVPMSGHVNKKTHVDASVPVDQIEGACPGAAGRVRLRYGTREDLSDARETEWMEVTEATDFTHHFELAGLKPDTMYHYVTETAAAGSDAKHGGVRGRFDTAPVAGAPSNLRFCVMTYQAYADREHPDGHPIYPSMLALAPQFVSMTGDVVYYDSDIPAAVSPALARLHWERMFSMPRIVDMLRNTTSYWLKDDHDTLKNDTWPGANAGTLSFAEGQQIFKEQTPMSGPGYRTFRWGRDLQVWFTDGRDHRSPNNMPDGPDKTIWGAVQKKWFMDTVKASDATWKVLISPTPIVGPDRGNKNDNHANKGFTHEGDEIRAWMQANVPDNFFVVCGDRHWQYHSVHPVTKVREFSVGPASNSHASGSPGEDKTYHLFHKVQGGFLSVQLTGSGKESRIDFRHHDVDGNVAHEYSATRAVG
jgi:alkaline phosphatase D